MDLEERVPTAINISIDSKRTRKGCFSPEWVFISPVELMTSFLFGIPRGLGRLKIEFGLLSEECEGAGLLCLYVVDCSFQLI